MLLHNITRLEKAWQSSDLGLKKKLENIYVVNMQFVSAINFGRKKGLSHNHTVPYNVVQDPDIESSTLHFWFCHLRFWGCFLVRTRKLLWFGSSVPWRHPIPTLLAALAREEGAVRKRHQSTPRFVAHVMTPYSIKVTILQLLQQPIICSLK